MDLFCGQVNKWQRFMKCDIPISIRRTYKHAFLVAPSPPYETSYELQVISSCIHTQFKNRNECTFTDNMDMCLLTSELALSPKSIVDDIAFALEYLSILSLVDTD